MKIADRLIKERIMLDIDVVNKEDAIRAVSFSLKDADEITDYVVFLNDVLKRESLASTGIGGETAIPHARTDAVKEFVIAMGRTRQGIDFGSLDKKPVRLVFLMGTPSEKGIKEYLKIIAHLSRLLKKENLRKVLLEAQKPEEIIKVLREYEA